MYKILMLIPYLSCCYCCCPCCWQVRETFLQDFNLAPEQLFTSFDIVPVASASLAQVRVCGGGEVAGAVCVGKVQGGVGGHQVCAWGEGGGGSGVDVDVCGEGVCV